MTTLHTPLESAALVTELCAALKSARRDLYALYFSRGYTVELIAEVLRTYDAVIAKAEGLK